MRILNSFLQLMSDAGYVLQKVFDWLFIQITKLDRDNWVLWILVVIVVITATQGGHK